MRVKEYTLLREQIEAGIKRILWNEDLTKPKNQAECDVRAEIWADRIIAEIGEYFDFTDDQDV